MQGGEVLRGALGEGQRLVHHFQGLVSLGHFLGVCLPKRVAWRALSSFSRILLVAAELRPSNTALARTYYKGTLGLLACLYVGLHAVTIKRGVALMDRHRIASLEAAQEEHGGATGSVERSHLA
jgi:hypothetical protein